MVTLCNDGRGKSDVQEERLTAKGEAIHQCVDGELMMCVEWLRHFGNGADFVHIVVRTLCLTPVTLLKTSLPLCALHH